MIPVLILIAIFLTGFGAGYAARAAVPQTRGAPPALRALPCFRLSAEYAICKAKTRILMNYNWRMWCADTACFGRVAGRR